MSFYCSLGGPASSINPHPPSRPPKGPTTPRRQDSKSEVLRRRPPVQRDVEPRPAVGRDGPGQQVAVLPRPVGPLVVLPRRRVPRDGREGRSIAGRPGPAPVSTGGAQHFTVRHTRREAPRTPSLRPSDPLTPNRGTTIVTHTWDPHSRSHTGHLPDDRGSSVTTPVPAVNSNSHSVRPE